MGGLSVIEATSKLEQKHSVSQPMATALDCKGPRPTRSSLIMDNISDQTQSWCAPRTRSAADADHRQVQPKPQHQEGRVHHLRVRVDGSDAHQLGQRQRVEPLQCKASAHRDTLTRHASRRQRRGTRDGGREEAALSKLSRWRFWKGESVGGMDEARAVLDSHCAWVR